MWFGVIPTQRAKLRLGGVVLVEQHAGWQVSRHYFNAESLSKLLTEGEAEPWALATSTM
jgi:hypothetical protein